MPSCAWVFCHGGDLLVNFVTREQAYDTLVGVPAEFNACLGMGLVRVVPGDPDASFLFMKVTDPPCGERMPLLYGYSGMLDPREIAQIREWIALGAPND